MVKENPNTIFANLARKASSKDNLSLEDLTRAHNYVEDGEHTRQQKTFVIKQLLRIVGWGGVALVLLLFFQGTHHVPGLGYEFALNEWAVKIFVGGYLGCTYGLLRYVVLYYFSTPQKSWLEKLFELLSNRKTRSRITEFDTKEI